jgi:hypothetical protein
LSPSSGIPDKPGHACPYDRQLRTPAQGSGLAGARNLRAPPVGAPYGIPLNVFTPFML